MRRALQAVAVAGVASLLVLLVWGVVHGQGSDVAKKVDAGEIVAAPALSFPRLDRDGRFDLAAYRGKVVVVNFWASWCVGCKEEARMLVDASRRWQGQDVVFVGVDAQDLSGPAKKFAAKYGVDYHLIRDGAGSSLGHWGVTGFPETFFVDRKGRLVPPHIVGTAKRADVDAGIRRALST